jgi:hypothetical protein
MDFDGLDRLWDTNRENASCVERLTQRLVIDAEVTRHRVDPEARQCLDALSRPLDLVKKRQHIAGIVRIALGHPVGKDKTRGRVRRDTGLATKLRGAIALAFEDRRDGEIVGIDEFTVAEFFALGELGGLLADVRMAAHRRVERIGQTLALGVAQSCRLRKAVLGLLPKRGNGLAKLKEVLFSLAHQFHEDLPLPSTLAPKATHDFFELLLQALGLARELRGPAAAPLCDTFNQLEGFF